MSAKRVILMYISEVSGHHRATMALEKSLKILKPNIEILNLNALNYTNPILERVISKAYMGVIKRTPEIWEYLYDNPKVARKIQKLKALIHKFNSQKLNRLLKNFKPDVIACTQAFPCGMVADYKKFTGSKILLFGVLTDYAPHSYWLYDKVDYYIVASEESKDWFIRSGIAEEKIKLLGIPIDPEFSREKNPMYIKEKLELHPSLPTILILGGGQGIGPIKNLVLNLEKSALKFQMIVVAGTNKKLYHWFKKRRDTFSKKAIFFGYTDSMDELMEVSTAAITKPGGLTVAESLAKGLPLVILNPIPGQEENNTNFLLKRKVALRAKSQQELRYLLESLLSNGGKIRDFSLRAKKIGKPIAALEIAKLILKSR